MVKPGNIVFNLAALISFAVGLLIVFLTGVLIAIGSMGGLRPKATFSELAVYLVVFILICILPVSSGALVLNAWKQRELPSWVRLTSFGVIGIVASLGILSLFLDPGDFFWSGAPMLLFAAAMLTAIRNYPVEALQ